MPLSTVGSQKAQLQAYVSSKRGVSGISPQRCRHIPWLWMFGISVLRPGCGSVSGAFQLCRSQMGDLPERRIAVVRQEEANPMKTVASALTLLAGNRNGEAGFKKKKKKRKK